VNLTIPTPKQFASHDIETLSEFGERVYGVRHNPATYSRKWRKVRLDGTLINWMAIDNYQVLEVSPMKGEKAWQVIPVTSV
jgi:hypothetical protein